jgi:8-oxo-dGTP diphosphatase
MKEEETAKSSESANQNILQPLSFSLHPSERIEVAAAVVFNDRGEFLLAQRPQGKVYAGYWEFPGGKFEPGERGFDAVRRELHEELGIEVAKAYPWLTRDFDYPHAAVRLRFWRVLEWSGRMHGREQQAFAWQSISNLTVGPLLPANGPILRALELPHAYAITCASLLGEQEFLARLEKVLHGGLRFLQVREPQMDRASLGRFAAKVIASARRIGARVVINGDVELAAEVGADGVHLSAARLLAAARRPAVDWCGASCHNETELARARELGVDFVVVGAVQPTLSHPGGTAIGWDRLGELLCDYPLPAYALGGLRKDDLPRAWSCGAHGISMMRAAWQPGHRGQQSSSDGRSN